MKDYERVPLEPMRVSVVDNGRTDRAEPAYDASWDDETRVRWRWGYDAARTGVELRVTAIRRPGRRTRFLVGCGPVGYSDCAGEAACQLIHDLSVGWQAGHEAAGRHL